MILLTKILSLRCKICLSSNSNNLLIKMKVIQVRFKIILVKVRPGIYKKIKIILIHSKFTSNLVLKTLRYRLNLSKKVRILSNFLNTKILII